MLQTLPLDRSDSVARTEQAHTIFTVSSAIFDALEELHGLSLRDAELLLRAVAGLRFIRSTHAYTRTDHLLFRMALVDLSEREAWIVESAAGLAAEWLPTEEPDDWHSGDSECARRALWLGALLRLADAVCLDPTAGQISEVYAAWTAEMLYLEFDGSEDVEPALRASRDRVALLEALSARRVMLTSAHARRGAA